MVSRYHNCCIDGGTRKSVSDIIKTNKLAAASGFICLFNENVTEMCVKSDSGEF
jgi:hypothetical protein